ncbi:HAD family hydrolase [Enterococcus saccharolyticus]|uniref:HAD family hydrolase n=1 Tax=Enterococcus saccharolyticus TaxID=41997 RepID=UPI001E583D2E|nr:HAD family hydrolase [Enterococcus saccharolyticus]MCD5001152.1 HAD family hydrolase [Enterococcus saccharolyticus]
MNHKLIFLDVDGTLCDETGRVPESAKQAITQAQQAGHQFFLCTGRTKGEITDELLGLNFRGMIGAGGGYCEVDGEVILHETLPQTELLEMLAYFRAENIAYYLQSSEELIASSDLRETLSELLLQNSGGNPDILDSVQWFFDLLKDETNVDYQQMEKICFVNNKVPYQEIYQRFHPYFAVIPTTTSHFGTDSGEVSVKGLSKKTVIEFLLNHLQVNIEDTIAFGDGHNDVEMFEAVGLSVAMGNASDSLKVLADGVTSHINQDGLAHGLKKYVLN